jgi:hypothetical protein
MKDSGIKFLGVIVLTIFLIWYSHNYLWLLLGLFLMADFEGED